MYVYGMLNITEVHELDGYNQEFWEDFLLFFEMCLIDLVARNLLGSRESLRCQKSKYFSDRVTVLVLIK